MLDPNLVSAIWGSASVYGVLVALLIQRADQNLQTFIGAPTYPAHQRAMTWARTTRAIPLVALATVAVLSLVALVERHGVSITAPPSANVWIMVVGIATMAIFVAIVGILVTKVPPYDLPALTGEAADAARPLESLIPTKVVFDNQRSDPVTIRWRNFDGVEETYVDQLLPKQLPSEILDTYATHPWVVRDSQGQLVAVFVARSVPGLAVIR